MPANEIILQEESGLVSGFPAENKLTLTKVRSAYHRLAPVYNLLFGTCFGPGQRAAVEVLASGPNERILEVGVGTGLALPHWNPRARVTGIDVSERMLQRAQDLCQRHNLQHVELQLMDAQTTSFPDNHFDKIAAMYVVSVVPNLPALLAEMKRICKPGGRIAIVNHFAQTNPVISQAERWLGRHASVLGFHASLPVEQVTHTTGLRLLQQMRVNWGGYWTLLVFENEK